MASREDSIRGSFAAYHAATQLDIASGAISAEQGGVFAILGDTIKAVVDVSKNISDSEVMALLAKAQDFAQLLVGAQDSDEGKATRAGRYYRQQLAPIITKMLADGVIEPESLPKGVAEKAATCTKVDCGQTHAHMAGHA